MQMATLEQLNNMMQQMHKQSVSTLNSDPKDVLSLPIVQKVIMAYEDELKLNKSSKDCKCKCDEFIPTILEHLDKHNLRLQLIENRLDDLFSLLKNKESSEPVIDKNQTKLTSFPGFGQIPLSDHIMMGLSLQDTYLKSLEISEEPCLESQQSCLESQQSCLESQQSCLEKELHNLETQQHLLEEESHELDTQQNLLEEESRELEWHRLKEEAHCLDEEIHSLNEEFRTLKENLQQSYLEEELHCSDQENITLNIEEIEAETDDLEEEIDDAVEEESEDAVEEETEDPEDAVEEETEDAVEEETEDAVEEETEDAVVAEPVEDASDETDSTEEEVVTEEDEDEVTNVAKEEEQDEEEEGEEVFEIEIDDVTYFATDEENGILYEVDKDGDIGKKVGIIKDGEPIFS
jgi:hypothetical protein